MPRRLLAPRPPLVLLLTLIATSVLGISYLYTVHTLYAGQGGVRGPHYHSSFLEKSENKFDCPKKAQATATRFDELEPPPRGHQRRISGVSNPQIASYVECQRGDVAGERFCHFENVCWDRDHETFTFFSDPDTPDELVVHESGIASLSDPGVLAELVRTTAGIPHRPEFLPLAFKKAVIPVDEAAWHMPHVHVAFRSFWAENFGHALGDDIMPAYSLMKAFRLVTDDVQLLTIGPCCDILVPYHGMDGYERAKRNLHNMTKLISRYTFADTSTEAFFSKRAPDAANALTQKRYTCMRHLLAGHAKLGIGFDRDFAWSSFVEAALSRARGMWPEAWHALGPLDPGRRLIVVVKKEGRRQVLNHDALVAGLRDSFSSDPVKQSLLGSVDVLSVDPASLSLAEQIALCQRADLVITPCGGISFFASFLQQGKAAIFIGYWDTHSKRSENMEGFLWRYVTRQHAFFYNVKKEEITVLPPGDATRAKWSDYRDYGAVTVNVDRMVALSMQALRVAVRDR